MYNQHVDRGDNPAYTEAVESIIPHKYSSTQTGGYGNNLQSSKHSSKLFARQTTTRAPAPPSSGGGGDNHFNPRTNKPSSATRNVSQKTLCPRPSSPRCSPAKTLKKAVDVVLQQQSNGRRQQARPRNTSREDDADENDTGQHHHRPLRTKNDDDDDAEDAGSSHSLRFQTLAPNTRRRLKLSDGTTFRDLSKGQLEIVDGAIATWRDGKLYLNKWNLCLHFDSASDVDINLIKGCIRCDGTTFSFAWIDNMCALNRHGELPFAVERIRYDEDDKKRFGADSTDNSAAWRRAARSVSRSLGRATSWSRTALSSASQAAMSKVKPSSSSAAASTTTTSGHNLLHSRTRSSMVYQTKPSTSRASNLIQAPCKALYSLLFGVTDANNITDDDELHSPLDVPDSLTRRRKANAPAVPVMTQDSTMTLIRDSNDSSASSPR